MNDDKKSRAKGFLELGIAFAQFSAKADEKIYETICTVASPLKLEVPDYDRLLAERRDGVVIPPQEWFEGSDGESLRIYSRIGTLSFAMFLLGMEKQTDRDAVQELRALFRAESISQKVLDDYLAAVKTGDAAGAFRGFLPNFSKALDEEYTEPEDVNTEDRLKFNALHFASSCFEKDMVNALADTLKETAVCYENQCYRATVMLCGTVTEALIKNVYKPLTGKEIYTTNRKGEEIERTFKNMCDDLRDQDGFFNDKRISEILALIYGHRSGASHKLWRPGQQRTYGIAIFTNDFMNGLFAYLNDHPLDSEKVDC